MIITLRVTNKLGFVEGSLRKPDLATGAGPMELQAWEIVNSMVSSCILNVIQPKLCSSIAHVESAHVMWSMLKKRYGMANVPKIHRLKASIADCKQGGLDVEEFYLKL